MNATNSLRRFVEPLIIIISLSAIIFLPRVFAGWWYFDRAQNYLVTASYVEAARAYEDAAHRLWWQAGIFEQAANSAWQAGDAPAALRLFENARENDGLTSSGKLTIGDIYSQAGETSSAIAAWESVGSGTPDSASAFSRLAIAERKMGNLDAALQHWQAVLKIEPQNGQAHYNLGLLMMTFQPGLALPELMLALTTDPDLDEQVQVLRQGLNLASLQENLAYQLVLSGRSLALIGAWDLALEAFIQASNADPEFSEAWAWQGEADQHLGRDGSPALKKALELDRNSIMSLALNGLYFRRNELIDPAWSVYLRAATLDPENSAWQEVLGELSAQKGNMIDALMYYQKAVDLAPQNPVSWRTLALFCVQYNVNIADIGLPAALNAIRLEPDNWRSQDVMGQVSMATGDLVKAAGYFEKSIKIAPDQPDSHLHLGYLKLIQDQRAEAYDSLVTARRLDPDGSVGWQAQRLLDQYFP